MPGSSMWSSLKLSLGNLGMTNAALSSMDYAAGAYLHEQDVRSPKVANAAQSGLRAAVADGPAGPESPRLPVPGTLPEGFVRINDARHLALLGRWPLLEDRMPACLPLKALLAMRFRYEQGDPDADAWLKLYARAFSGEAEAQRVFGRVCENGAFRAPADVQRAFFWYYRAALQGDVAASMAAERLRHATRISAAAMAEPMLLYPGPWRITAGRSGQASSKSFFELEENGTASGHPIGGSGVAAEIIKNALRPFAAPFSQSLFLPVMQNVRYDGSWAYYGSRKILTLEFDASATGMPDSRRDTWQIELIGCRMGALYGRDRRMFSYILEYAAPHAETEPLTRVDTAVRC